MERMVVTGIITRGNSQKLCLWKLRFGSKKKSCPRVVQPPRDLGDLYPWRFPKTLPISVCHAVAQRDGRRQCRPGLCSTICSHGNTSILARPSCWWQNYCILPPINFSGTAEHFTVSLCSLHTLEGFPKTALFPERVLSRQMETVTGVPLHLCFARLHAPSSSCLPCAMASISMHSSNLLFTGCLTRAVSNVTCLCAGTLRGVYRK